MGKDVITVGYTTHKQMIDERDKRIQHLEKALDKACNLIVEAQHDDCYVTGCFKSHPNNCDFHCPTVEDWKGHFLKGL